LNEIYNDKIREFDQFFCNNYKYLIGFSKSINPQADYESLTHDLYLRARNRIADNGFSGDTFLNYTRVGLMNLYKSHYRTTKKHQLIDIENPDYYNLTEEVLAMKEYQDIQQEEQNQTNTYLTSNVYEYLDRYATPKEQYIFKTYYLLKHHHINYKQLSEITGYSITSVSNIIKRLKKQLRRDLNSYIINGLTMDELLEQTRMQLLEPINAGNWENYKALYKRIYGVDYRKCECKRQNLMNEIINWYNQNK
jgi:RNA polymerase sigma factor (sigma-70 family)